MRRYQDGPSCGCMLIMFLAAVSLVLTARCTFNTVADWIDSSESPRPRTVRAPNPAQTYMDTFVVLGVGHTHCPRGHCHQSLQMINRRGHTVISHMEDPINRTQQAAPIIMRGDSLLVERTIGPDSAKQMRIMRNITAERMARQLIKQR